MKTQYGANGVSQFQAKDGTVYPAVDGVFHLEPQHEFDAQKAGFVPIIIHFQEEAPAPDVVPAPSQPADQT